MGGKPKVVSGLKGIYQHSLLKRQPNCLALVDLSFQHYSGASDGPDHFRIVEKLVAREGVPGARHAFQHSEKERFLRAGRPA
jgi:hypothetical protein